MMTAMTPAILGLVGPELSADETALFRAANPAGFILFARNIVDPGQLRRLTDALRALHGRDDLAILIDQEGGRVARLKPPHWPVFPAAICFDRLYELAPVSALAAVEANALAIALYLSELGITVNCLPLLDVRQANSHPVVADRCFGAEPLRVAALGRAALQGLASGGVVGVVKHMPGQGRATSDSHVVLPRVDASAQELEHDLSPFRALSDACMGMTAHVVYTAWDADHCATQSPIVIDQIIRTAIGFDGLLMTDGLEMEALSGSMADRAERALAAGVDIALHCSGDFTDMADMVDRLGGAMQVKSRDRLDRAMQSRAGVPSGLLASDAIARRDAYLALAE